ncbi:MAG: PEP/pyruvate-binding domain-containing protein, partial [Planctomycetes bacterium]|nr:PEP/pyruvate-binding domain-containing protein [Planctomycetota bacterium]
MPTFERVLSGMPGVDALIDNIRMGDNVVWQLDTIDQYREVVQPIVAQARADRRNLHYVRFAAHPPILEPQDGLTVHRFDPDAGFETFTVRVHELIAAQGRDAFYIFDSLSELQTAWASDLMMGCFFQVTCPYLFQMNTVAVFGILRNRHSFDAIARIRETTQLLLDLYGQDGERYLQPLKVWNRYSPTMFSPHRLTAGGAAAVPLTDAVEAARFNAILNDRFVAPVDGTLDHWDRTFMQAGQELAHGGENPDTRRRLAGLLMGRDPRIASLVREHFTVADLIRVKERMIGSGGVGGKTAGMLLARKIVENRLPDLRPRLEPHDSFYIGSDVFYAFLVENGWWKLRLEQRTADGYFTAAAALGERMEGGTFPAATRDRFRRLLDHFGQSPIIVRSSSLLEDGFGNAFAGKYESYFLVNAGTPEERFEAFERAVKQVYASAMDPSALTYRRQRGLDDQDEQMAILVQRVSGANFDGLFMPVAAGVGHSHNAYVWDSRIDPAAGMVRLVAGLGTRAVDRVESDYPRVAALNDPGLMPVSGAEERAKYSQRFVDVLDLGSNTLRSLELAETAARWPEWLRRLLCERDYAAESAYAERGIQREILYCNCDAVVANTAFIRDMRNILSTLHAAYSYPVDIEFTVNFAADGAYVVNLLQCRPLQTRERGATVTVPEIPDERIYFRLDGSVMGGGIDWPLD